MDNETHTSHRLNHQAVASDRKKRIVRKLGTIETFVGISCLVIGIAVVVIALNNKYRTIGEGIWAPIFVILAGIFGKLAGGKKSSRFKINAHLGTGVVAALFSFVLMCIASGYSLEGKGKDSHLYYYYGVIILAILSFINMMLLITSTTYACCMMEGCICCCDVERRSYESPMMYSQVDGRRGLSQISIKSQPK